ncbi:MAG: electron transfer flavoprotein subunit alpha/FixB family protein, partial [Rhodothermales bacterium]|nr:electron transfer flavoprotein subunit alpha/FixB family protein [Rhodothermales bacterium]
MSSILAYLAPGEDGLKRSSLEVLTRCRALAEQHGARLEAVILHPEAARFTDAAARYGAARVYTVAHPVFAQPLNPPVVEALVQVIEQAQPRLVAFATSEAVKDVLGALAVRTDAAALPDVSAFDLVEGGVEAVRPVLASRLLARTRAEADRVLVSVRAGAYDAAEAPTDAEVVSVEFSYDEGAQRQTLREVVTAGGEAVDLSEARVVVAAGRGVRDAEGQRLVEELASVLGAALGASRAVVESGLFPATAQVGQTGKVVSPDLYIAVGISGAVQHT